VLKQISYIAILVSLTGNLFSQKLRCSSHYNDFSFYDTHVKAMTRTPKTVQLVFHILYQTEEENISDEVIAEQIQIINDDFNGLNSDLTAVPDFFQEFIGNPEISFVLTSEDQNGLPFSGVFRQMTDIDNIASQFSADGKEVIKYKVLGGSDAFFPESHINVWIGRSDDIFGVTSPLEYAGTADDGIIITPEAFGTNDDPTSITNLGRTMTHELGHYFGLNHLWGKENGCDNDDGIEDTPIQEGPYIDCLEFPQLSCESFDMHMNFMDFSNDECLLFFTQGQVEIMQQTLAEIRSGTIVSTTDIGRIEEIPDIDIKIINNQVSISSPIDLEGPFSISIYSIEGRRIYKDLLNDLNVYEIDTNQWTRGVYILSINSVDQRFTHTFVAGN